MKQKKSWPVSRWHISRSYRFVAEITFKLLPFLERKVFLMCLKNSLPAFVLALRQYWGLNHMILRLRDFLLFVLVPVVLGINVMLPWKPLSECIWIYWDRLIKNIFAGRIVRDPFSHCFRYFFNYSRGVIQFDLLVIKLLLKAFKGVDTVRKVIQWIDILFWYYGFCISCVSMW